MVAVDTPEGLTARLQGAETLYVQVDAQGAEAEPVLRAIPGVTRVALVGPSRPASTASRSRARAAPTSAATSRARSSTRGWGLLELRPMRMSLEEIFLQVTTEEGGAAACSRRRRQRRAGRRDRRGRRAVNSVRNILAIAGKELRSYFASPIAYVIIGLFALLFGLFFYAYLTVFVQRSSGMGQMGGGANNINQDMIRYVLLNSAVIILFVMPMITMRTYSEEKRSGTIELLLTSPLTDLEIILGKFLGAMGLYCAMLAGDRCSTWRCCSATAIPNGGRRRRLSRAAAAGRLLHLAGPADLEPDQEPDRRRRHHLRGVPDAVDHQLVRRSVGPDDAGGR